MGVGRFLCVALPFLLTVASLIALLTATLSGVVSSDSLHIFSVDISKLAVDPSTVSSALADITGRDASNSDVVAEILTAREGNITAGDLGLAEKYDINLWGYCSSGEHVDRHCTKAKFNWASSSLNTSFYEHLGEAAGVHLEIPDDIKSALKTFSTVTKYTEIVFIIALVSLGLELFVGIFANFSRVASCFTWLIGAIAAFFVGASAGLATATAAIVAGAIDTLAHSYGAKGSIGGNFLAAVWIAAACAIASGLFWIFTICCCKPQHRRSDRRNKHNSMGEEKLLPSGQYAPLGSDNEGGYGHYDNRGFEQQYSTPTLPQYHQDYNSGYHTPSAHHQDYNSGYHTPGANQDYYQHEPQYSGYTSSQRSTRASRTDLAYEPYSHRTQ